MTAVRDNLCDLNRMEIPRFKVNGMAFVQTIGHKGFYKTIRDRDGSKYGIATKKSGPKRPMLTSDIFQKPETVREEDSDGTVSPVPPQRNNMANHSDNDDSSRSSKLSNYSVSPQPGYPIDLEPDYPSDYVPPTLTQLSKYKTSSSSIKKTSFVEKM